MNMMMGEPGQETVSLSELTREVTQDAYDGLVELAKTCPEKSDNDRKISLLKYINRTTQRLLRLNVLTKWCSQIPFVRTWQQLEGTLSSHELCFMQAADTLFFTHEGLHQASAPSYDVQTAMEVLATGNYVRLPKSIEDISIKSAFEGEEREEAFRKLNSLLRSKVLDANLPKEFSSVRTTDGKVIVEVKGEFKVHLTVGYRAHLSLWKILHLELLVGEKNGLLKLSDIQRLALGDDLERRMAAAEHPFMVLYSVLHEFCIALVMDTVIRQVRTLQQGRWKDAIRFELISDTISVQSGSISQTQVPSQDTDTDVGGMKTPGIKIMYWVDLVNSVGVVDSGCLPFLRIEPAHDQHISCTHNTYITDPLTDDEAKFTLDQSCIDVEGLLLRAISCNIHTRLVEVEKVLKGNNKLYQSEDDIILKQPGNLSKKTLIKISEFLGKATLESGEVEEEVLCVRTYGLCYVALGINIRNGRFTLRASRNLLLSSAITEDEDALNQGSRAPADVFISLRNKSILHLFASNGKFLGLKVYEKGVATAKIPKEAIRGSEMLLMGFPDCGNSYYLLIQLDTHFKPNFTLLKSQESNGRSGVVSGSLQFNGYLKIDVGELQMVEDEVNLSLLDNNLPPSKEDIILDATADKVAPISYNSELVVQQGSSQSFSSVVDEVFNAEAGLSLQSAKHSNSTLMTEQSPLTGFQHTGKAGQPIPRRDGMLPASPNNIFNKSSVGASISPRLVNDLNNPNTRLGGLGSPPGGSATYGLNTSVSPSPLSPSFQRLSANPKNFSEQDTMIIDDDHQKKGMNSPKDGLSMYSPNRQTRGSSLLGTSPSQRSPILNSKPHFKGSPTGQPTSTLKGSATGMHMDSPTVQTSEGGATQGLLPSTPKQSATNRKRSLSDFINSMSSLQTTFTRGQIQKKRKITENHFSANSELDRFDECTGQLVGRTYDNILMEANSGKVPSTVYGTVLLQVVRHCSLFIKHARIVSQMDGLRMSYNEDVSLKKLSTDLWFRLPDSVEQPWRTIFLSLGKPGSMYWDVKVNDEHFRDLWELQKGKSGTSWGSGVRIANTSDADSHIRFCPEGVVLSYKTMEDVSVKQLLADLQRLCNARSFAISMKKLIEAKDERIDSGKDKGSLFKVPSSAKMGSGEGGEKVWEHTRKPFRIEAVGLMSLWFSYFGSMPGVIARFVVEWESGKEGCTMHVSPDQLWPHARFLEDFINGGEVAALLDCIRLTAGPLHALAGAIRPARMVGGAPTGITLVPPGFSVPSKTNGQTVSQVATQGSGSSPVISVTAGGLPTVPTTGATSAHNVPIISNSGRGGGPGIVPSSLLPTDVSVVLRSPYWIRIIYRKNFAVDMRCFAGDQVWLQPGTPPMGGHSLGGSMPCPQFRPFIMEHVALGLNNFDAVSPHSGSPGSLSNNANISVSQGLPANATRMGTGSPGVSRPAMLTSNASTIFSRVSNASNVLGAQNLAAFNGGMPLAGRSMIPGAGMPVHVRGELNTAFIGLGDDGGYGGGWVPLLALKKVLRGILKYLGVLWLFSQLPELLTVTLGSILKENEGALLNLDPEQPALRFFVGSYVFAVSVHRIQLLLQVLSVKRFQQQQHQQQQNQINIQDELSSNEINEICDYFSRRVASEPYDASRVASFITLLTLPISVLREFLKLISWKRGTAQGQNSDIAPSQRPRVELCLENHRGSGSDTLASSESGDMTGGSVAKSNIHYDRPHNAVEFGLTVVLDPASIPHINAAGGAAWLPYCVSVRLKYSFGENPQMYLLSMEGSHGGRACWPRTEDWERCRQKVAKAVEITGGSGASGSPVDISQGRLRVVAETLQLSLQTSLQQIRRTATPNSSSMPGSFSS